MLQIKHDWLSSDHSMVSNRGKNVKMSNCSCQRMGQEAALLSDIWGNASISAQHPVDGTEIKLLAQIERRRRGRLGQNRGQPEADRWPKLKPDWPARKIRCWGFFIGLLAVNEGGINWQTETATKKLKKNIYVYTEKQQKSEI